MVTVQHSRLVVVALGVAAMAFAGCGDDDDDDDGGGGNGAGPSGEGAAITQDNVGEVQGALGTSMATAFGKGPGTHDGAHSGTVTIAIDVGKAAAQAINYGIEFDNYSDDGVTWLDGSIQYVINGTNVSYTGDITISGAYSGSVQIDIQISGGGYSGSYTVNGETLSL